MINPRPSILLLANMAAALPAAAQQQELSHPQGARAESAAFSIRVDPSSAEDVNAVLARYAANAITDVPNGQDIAAFLSRRCGDKTVPDIKAVMPLVNGKRRVEHTPCARLGGSRTVTVEPGLTLEGIAARWGLRADKVSSLKIRSGEGNPSRASISPETMLPGDQVVVPQTSLWTEIRLKPDLPVGRDGLVSAIADALGCTGDQEVCVRGKGVLVLKQGGSVVSPPQPAPTSDSRVPEAATPDLSLVFSRVERLLPNRDLTLATEVTSVPISYMASAEAQATAVEPMAPSAMPVPVAPDQWPYDVRRVSAILAKDRDLLRFVRVGVADGGLGNATGSPLPTSLLVRNGREFDDGDIDDDDDENSYIDDFYGAGLKRSDENLADEILGTGKLDLCPAQPDFASWPMKGLLRASHGAVVSSIAAGWPLRGPDQAAWPKLPRLQFYRMVTKQCAPDIMFSVEDGEINKALRYLFGQDAEVVNLSYKISIRGDNRDLRDAARAELNNDTRMLVVAAGQDDSDNLDDGKLCPACLASPVVGDLSRRVLAVGAAERTLRSSPGSNQGEKTVRFYAPGQGAGMDILGRPISDPKSATSYAGPYAAFAIALLKGYDIKNYWEITERLEAASWPLLMADGSWHPTARVIDITKVVGIYHDVIEATVIENGVAVRRDYVGTIVPRIQDLTICKGVTFKRATVHSIRLGAVGPGSLRFAQWEERQDGESFAQRTDLDCRSSGAIEIDDILDHRVVIPLEQVNQILLRWDTPQS